MLKQIDSNNLEQLRTFLKGRMADADPVILNNTAQIIQNVKENGDAALFSYTKQFDHVSLSTLQASEEEIEEAFAQVDLALIQDLKEAAQNITYYHEQQKAKGYHLEKEAGVYLGQRVLPLARVGVYVPGGRAAYPSTVLMNVLPAKIAGVKEIVMVTPPDKEGKIAPVIAAAAKIAGVTSIYKVGGAQAVAALAYGTETIPQVDKIVGPGNAYVASAKRLVFGQVDIDMIAGPSEILVIADKKADPRAVAADLISQAEHDPLACSILLTVDSTLARDVQQELKRQSALLDRKEIIEKSLSAYGTLMICKDIEQCIAISNQIAPEHLELMVENANDYLEQVYNAGSIFLGYVTCESIGDYFGGTNHVLPTNGTARFASALSCDDFVKRSCYLHYSKQALQRDGAKIMNIATHEGLGGHANAVKVRLDNE